MSRGAAGRRTRERHPFSGFPPLVLALLALLPASPAMAQLTGRVTDPEGAAIPDATVEAWSGTARVAQRLSAEDGSFSFPASVANRTTALYVHRIGYRALRVERHGRGGESLDLTLVPEPILLGEVVAIPLADPCEAPEDRSAREAWSRLRGDYFTGVDTMGVATYLSHQTMELPIGADAPRWDEAGAAIDQRGSSFLLRVGWRRRVERSGYAYTVRRIEGGRGVESWVQAPLHADFAPHFIDPVFGELHRFHEVEPSSRSAALGPATEEGRQIRFCPRRDDRARIRGTMSIGTDGSLRAVEWALLTDDPQEGAGGRVFFGPATDPASALLPVESLLWRTVAPEWRRFERERYEGWISAPGDSVPFLPPRRGGNAPSSGSGGPPSGSTFPR